MYQHCCSTNIGEIILCLFFNWFICIFVNLCDNISNEKWWSFYRVDWWILVNKTKIRIIYQSQELWTLKGNEFYFEKMIISMSSFHNKNWINDLLFIEKNQSFFGMRLYVWCSSIYNNINQWNRMTILRRMSVHREKVISILKQKVIV